MPTHSARDDMRGLIAMPDMTSYGVVQMGSSSLNGMSGASRLARELPAWAHDAQEDLC